ncbi:MAG: phage head closure protein [Hyphomicrobium sp.]
MKSPVHIGDLDKRVAIEREVRVSDGGGGATVTWAHVAEVWAAIWPRSASESFTQDRVAGTATHDVWMRYRKGVVPGMRLRLDARWFDIRGVIDADERRRWLKCIVEEQDL